ncbi:hypothetical protein ACFX13_030202 [Malus domestica]|nr:7-ethoxycoumarin O-deethylase-like [Malus domestica]XP_050138899.1 7-ethoxycoumarin O-deethylase-like [Malus sylvestris]
MDFLQLTSTSIAISTYLSSFPLYMLIAVATIIVIGIRLLSCNPKNWKNSPPGPSGWPILGSLPQLLNKRLHEEFLDLSKIHGPLFSLKLGLKPAIVISSPEMVSKTLRQHEAVFSSRTVTEAIRVITYDTASIVYAAMASPRWRVIRKILTEELFSRKAFEDFEPVRKQQVHGGLLKHLYSTSLSKNSVNIAEVAFVASGNIVSNTVCSKSLFDSTKKQGRELKHTFWELMQILGSVNVTDLLPIFKPFDPQGLKRRILKIFWRMDAFYENIIKERLEERETGNNIGKHKLDLLDVLLDYRSDKEDELKRLSRNNIKAMLAEMFIAGTETTSSTVEWGMTEILRNPNVYKKVLMELDQVVGNDRFVEERDISNLPYLQAAVKEVFRLHPAVPLIVPRRTNEACEVSGYHIPKDCIVFVNVWGMARDHTIWEEPCEFKPERFIGSSVDVKGQDFNLMPFGTGKRICVGMPLGQRMVHFYLAALLHAFEWECSLEILDSLEEKVGLTIEKGKSLVGIPKPRLSPSVYLQ